MTSETSFDEARDSDRSLTKSKRTYNLTPVWGFTSSIAPGLYVSFPLGGSR